MSVPDVAQRCFGYGLLRNWCKSDLHWSHRAGRALSCLAIRASAPALASLQSQYFSLAGLCSLTFGAWFWRVAAGFCGCLWWCFVMVLVCVCFGFRACDCHTSSVETHKNAYCAADVVKRRRSKKNAALENGNSSCAQIPCQLVPTEPPRFAPQGSPYPARELCETVAILLTRFHPTRPIASKKVYLSVIPHNAI